MEGQVAGGQKWRDSCVIRVLAYAATDEMVCAARLSALSIVNRRHDGLRGAGCTDQRLAGAAFTLDEQ